MYVYWLGEKSTSMRKVQTLFKKYVFLPRVECIKICNYICNRTHNFLSIDVLDASDF